MCSFDFLVILTQETLGEEEVAFVKEAKRWKQPVAFIRSRCDEALQSLLLEGAIDAIDQNAANEVVQQSAFTL